MLYAFFETGTNYKWVHSAWHVATAVVLALAHPKERYLPDPNTNPLADEGCFLSTAMIQAIRRHFRGAKASPENNADALTASP